MLLCHIFVVKVSKSLELLFRLCYAVKVRRLLAVCPKNTGGTGGTFRVDQRGLDAVLALGIYHLESGLKVSVTY